MKKILLLISMFLFIVNPVYARENRLYFTESGERIYYESKLLDEKFFLNHIEMIPGESFTDELLIENGTKTKYTLYFKIVPREQSKEANELLEYVKMKISIDGEVIYDGKATGLDYTNNGINLQNAIQLGEFTPNKKSKMVVETTLSEEYTNTKYKEFSYIDWSFYAQYGDNLIVMNPNTGDNISKYLTIAIGSGVAIIIIAFLYMKKIKHI